MYKNTQLSKIDTLQIVEFISKWWPVIKAENLGIFILTKKYIKLLAVLYAICLALVLTIFVGLQVLAPVHGLHLGSLG